MRNIEAKYRCADLDGVRRRAEGLGARDAGGLRQTDHYFEAPHGRLKLRVFDSGAAELIGYTRADAAAARSSDYFVYRTARPDELAAVLRHSPGSRGVVRKTRSLLLWKSTRIHLDDVEGLGTFVELETGVGEQGDDAARAELDHVATALHLDAGSIVAVAYVDLLGQTSPSSAR